MMKYAAICLCLLLFAVLVKERSRPVAFSLSLSGVCLVLFCCLHEAAGVFDELHSLTQQLSGGAAYLRLTVKVLVITLLTQVVSDICRDNGEGALASVTEIAAKLTVITLVLPLFKTVITLVSGLIK